MKKKKVTPLEQLCRELQTEEQKDVLMETIEPMAPEYRDDFCLACTAYIRFGIRRRFNNHLMNVLFAAYTDLLDQ